MSAEEILAARFGIEPKRKIVLMELPERIRWTEHEDGSVLVNIACLKQVETWAMKRKEA